MNIAKKTPEAVIDTGIADLRKYVDEELARRRDFIMQDIDERMKALKASLELSQNAGYAGTLYGSEVLLVKDVDLSHWETTLSRHSFPFEISIDGYRHRLGEAELKSKNYRVVLALIPLEKKP